jgi:hypothetical protein
MTRDDNTNLSDVEAQEAQEQVMLRPMNNTLATSSHENIRFADLVNARSRDLINSDNFSSKCKFKSKVRSLFDKVSSFTLRMNTF